MSVRANPGFLAELSDYGAFDITACFNCGNCTAICPLSTESEAFPRKMIRYAQVGLSERLLSTKELWLCYYCGECSDTCPRQAEPGEFMAASRRYAIGRYDVTRLAPRLYTSSLFSFLFLLVMAAFLTLLMLSQRGPMMASRLALFEFIPAALIHDIGVAILVIVFLVALLSVINMVRTVYRARGPSELAAAPSGIMQVLRLWVTALVHTILSQVLAHQRYRECDQEKQVAWPIRPWFYHMSMALGFFGLLAATMLDWILDLAGIKPTGTMVPLWYPIRLLGTVSGLLLMYGASVVILKRLIKTDKPSSHSLVSDWIFLLLLWTAGVTGFALEIALYLPAPQVWAYYMLIIHVVISMELIFLAPFTKFAHVFYRTVAVYICTLDRLRRQRQVVAQAGQA